MNDPVIGLSGWYLSRAHPISHWDAVCYASIWVYTREVIVRRRNQTYVTFVCDFRRGVIYKMIIRSRLNSCGIRMEFIFNASTEINRCYGCACYSVTKWQLMPSIAPVWRPRKPAVDNWCRCRWCCRPPTVSAQTRCACHWTWKTHSRRLSFDDLELGIRNVSSLTLTSDSRQRLHRHNATLIIITVRFCDLPLHWKRSALPDDIYSACIGELQSFLLQDKQRAFNAFAIKPSIRWLR